MLCISHAELDSAFKNISKMRFRNECRSRIKSGMAWFGITNEYSLNL